MLKVMIIEDEPSIAALLTKLLKLEGFDASALGEDRQEEIIHALQQDRPDVALVDVNLSGYSGIDLVRQIRRTAGIKDIRILMASGMNLKRECLQAGADYFILKPFMPDELVNLIRATANQ